MNKIKTFFTTILLFFLVIIFILIAIQSMILIGKTSPIHIVYSGDISNHKDANLIYFGDGAIMTILMSLIVIFILLVIHPREKIVHRIHQKEHLNIQS